MAKLNINGSRMIEGKLTVSRALVKGGDGLKLVVEGMLKTPEYIEEITSIDAPRFSVLGVEVFQESFGSEDPEIIYAFRAQSIEIEDQGGDIIDDNA